MKFGVMVLLSLAVCCAAQERPELLPPQYHLAFSDDFRHLDLSPDGRGAHRWYEGIWFSHSHAPLRNIQSTPDGLKLTWTRGQTQPDTSISTFSRAGLKTHSWRYGYFEIRMKWNPIPGAWPAVWLIPALAQHMRESGEMDIFEGNSERLHDFSGTVHHWIEASHDPTRMEDRENNGRTNRFPLSDDVDFSQYHVYGMLWTPDRIAWYFDGRKLHSERAYDIFNHQDYCLIIGMQEGADWKAGNLGGVNADRMDLDIDWVHVWQLLVEQR
jgi:beta-glucanase (GH16 family)